MPSFSSRRPPPLFPSSLLAECRRRRLPPLRRNCHDLPYLPSNLRRRRRRPLSSPFPSTTTGSRSRYRRLPPRLPLLSTSTVAVLLIPPISLSCRGWIIEADPSLLFSLHGLRSPAPPPRCSTSSLLSVSSSPTCRLLLPSSSSPSSPSSTSPLPWSPSATLFLRDVLPVGDLGICKLVQILRHVRTANPISPLTSLLSLSSVAATTTVGRGTSSIADRRRLLDLLLRRCRHSLTVDLLPSCLRPPLLPPLPVILTVNLPRVPLSHRPSSRWLATASRVGILVRP